MFEIGDKVTSTAYGKGVVINIVSNDVYPITVRFEDKEATDTFTTEGRYSVYDPTPTLIAGHHDKVKVVPDTD